MDDRMNTIAVMDDRFVIHAIRTIAQATGAAGMAAGCLSTLHGRSRQQRPRIVADLAECVNAPDRPPVCIG
jgi:hypothetical protein